MRLPHFRFFSKDVAGWLQISSSELLIATSNLSGWSQVTVFREINLVITPEKRRDKFPYISSEVFQKHQKTSKMHHNASKCIKVSYHWNSYVGLLSAPICSNGFLTTPSCQLRSLPFSTSPAAYPPPTVSMPKVKGVTSNRSKSCPPSPLKIPACTAAP